MGRHGLGQNVFDIGLARMLELYAAGHRVVVSFSAGKDSGACLELCILAAKMSNRLPVDVVMQDEEIAYPGTYEYALRTAQRPEVKFNWLVAHQPMVNVYNRLAPYYWVFDPLLKPEQWVRTPPDWATKITDQNITNMTVPERFPPAPGKELFAVIGLRTQESVRRRYSVHAAGGYLTKPNKRGTRNCRPIYDWSDGDVWKATLENKWDYNSAYNIFLRLGVARKDMRVGPPTMSVSTINQFKAAARAWPRWFAKVCDRCPGTRQVPLFGRRACTPSRRLGETWEECFERECVAGARKIGADWIADRAVFVRDAYVKVHARHSGAPFPEAEPCIHCTGGGSISSWKKLTLAMYNGDPYSLKTDGIGLPYVEPEFFRKGAGTWGGKPTW